MSACQMTDCYVVADKIVLYIELNSENSALMVNNSWVPISTPQVNVLDIVKTYKQNQIVQLIPQRVVVKNEQVGPKIFPTSAVSDMPIIR